MTPTVAVLTNTRDLAADDVVQRLGAADIHVVRVNADIVVNEPVPAWRSSTGSALDWGAVWWRQFELSADEIGSPTSANEIEDLLVTRAQWRAWTATLDDGRPWVNPLWAARRAENKVEQLRVAAHVGFRVPDTLITNDPGEADAFRLSAPAVVKTIAGSNYEMSGHGFVYTHDADEVLAPADLWLRQPVTVQTRVDGAHIRVVVVGEDVFAASCESDTLDWRLQETPSPWRRWDAPSAISDCCRQMLRVLGLHYGAFDFVDDGTTVWFLELNQAGEWAFLERPLGLGISQAVAEHLVRLASTSCETVN